MIGKTYRNPDYLKLAKGKPCMCCGRQDGTVVAAHYCGLEADRFGRGAGQKPHDFCVAFLCHKCHQRYDGYVCQNTAERSREFLMLCLQTMAMLIATGEIKIVPTSRQ